MQFTGLPTGTCSGIGQPGYQEYMLPADLQRFQTVGQRIVDAIAAVRGRVYTNQASIALYPTTGTHSDYVYSRHIADPRLRKTYGYTFETGPWAGNTRDSFHPADPTLIKRDAKSGMLALVQQCICAIELIGSRLLGRETEVSALRYVRDELLGTTEAGREWVALFEGVQGELLGIVLGDERLAQEAASLLEAAGRLVGEESARVPPDVLERGLALVRDLRERSQSAEVRGALEAVSGQLSELAGATSGDAIATLMRKGPAGGRRAESQ